MPSTPPDPESAGLIREPQQARSRRTLERIRVAAWELLAEGGAESITVVGVCEGARISVGSFYSRFRGKDDLLEHLEAVSLDEAMRSWTTAAAELDTQELLGHLVHLYRRGPARKLLLLSRGDGSSASQLDRLQRSVAEALARRLSPSVSTSDAAGDGAEGPSHAAGTPEAQASLRLGAALAAAARELALAADGPARAWLFGSPAGEGAAAAGNAAGELDSSIRSTLWSLASGRVLPADPATQPGTLSPDTPGAASAPNPDPDPDPPAAPVELFDIWG